MLKRTAMAELHYTNLRTPLAWKSWTTLISAVLLFHFIIAAGWWLLWLTAMLVGESRSIQFISSQLSCFVPASALCFLSVVVFILALRRSTIALPLLLVLIIGAAVLFWVDAGYHRYQISVDVVATDSWTGSTGGPFYFTWWWYNDRWFRP